MDICEGSTASFCTASLKAGNSYWGGVARKLAPGRVGTGLSPPGFLGGVLGREPLGREPVEPLGREPVEPPGREPDEPPGRVRLPRAGVGFEANFGFSILRS